MKSFRFFHSGLIDYFNALASTSVDLSYLYGFQLILTATKEVPILFPVYRSTLPVDFTPDSGPASNRSIVKERHRLLSLPVVLTG
jgi:hypothetical protein